MTMTKEELQCLRDNLNAVRATVPLDIGALALTFALGSTTERDIDGSVDPERIEQFRRVSRWIVLSTNSLPRLIDALERALAEIEALKSTLIGDIAGLRTERDDIHANLEKALARMDRARDILTDGYPRPDCNWGILDTSDLRAKKEEVGS